MRSILPLPKIVKPRFKRVGEGFAFFQRVFKQIDEKMRGGEGCGILILAMGRFIAQFHETEAQEHSGGFHRIGKPHRFCVIEERHGFVL